MKETLNKIVHDLENSDLASLFLGINGGLMELSLFFFYYSRFISDEKYENLGYEILELILDRIDINTIKSNYGYGTSGIGSCIDFLIKEQFIEIESEDFFEDLDYNIFSNIPKSFIWDYSFQTGLIGQCSYFLLRQGNKAEEAIRITLDQLCIGFAIQGFPKHPVETFFLMPSEILQDVKLFLRKIEKLQIYEEQTVLLKSHIEKFEKKHTVLQSNCPEYYETQYLRESVGFENKLLSKNMLNNHTTYIYDKALWGLTYMYYEKPALPNIWKIL